MPTREARKWRLTMADTTKFESHEQYMRAVNTDARAALTRIQAIVESNVPSATRCISYNMPAFRVDRTFFYFAAFKKHIGVYPPVTDNGALVEELLPYRNEKGNLAFALDRPIPYELIGRVARALSNQYAK
jgi:uncharacterized protein YdhG (YjbR/CyaY superfamily)